MFDLLEKFGIVYTDASHRYERFGVKLDSVTSVLPYLIQSEYLASNPQVIEKAGVRGHRVAEFIETVEVDPVMTPGRQYRIPALDEYREKKLSETPEYHYLRFKQETGFTALKSASGDLASELFVYHDILDYVGRLDICGYAPNTSLKGPGLVEVKATAVLPKTVGPQSAAYFEAFNRCAKLYDLPKLKWRASLHLTAKGYKFEPLVNPLDWPRFSSCLTATRWARELGFELEWKAINHAASPKGESVSPEKVFA